MLPSLVQLAPTGTDADGKRGLSPYPLGTWSRNTSSAVGVGRLLLHHTFAEAYPGKPGLDALKLDLARFVSAKPALYGNVRKRKSSVTNEWTLDVVMRRGSWAELDAKRVALLDAINAVFWPHTRAEVTADQQNAIFDLVLEYFRCVAIGQVLAALYDPNDAPFGRHFSWELRHPTSPPEVLLNVAVMPARGEATFGTGALRAYDFLAVGEWACSFVRPAQNNRLIHTLQVFEDRLHEATWSDGVPVFDVLLRTQFWPLRPEGYVEEIRCFNQLECVYDEDSE